MYNIGVTIKNLFVSASENNTKGGANQDCLLHLTNPDDFLRSHGLPKAKPVRRNRNDGKVGDLNKSDGNNE